MFEKLFKSSSKHFRYLTSCFTLFRKHLLYDDDEDLKSWETSSKLPSDYECGVLKALFLNYKFEAFPISRIKLCVRGKVIITR